MMKKEMTPRKRKKMDINKWKSCAVDIDTYCILRAMGSHGFRKPASMIAKIVDDEVKKISKKNGSSYDKTRENLLSQGKKLMNGK
jgi:hypothetical protein|tara:strand:- start:316 stop:570 length:255 start_codon:yes stop_codon:yes gene_type:complete